MDCKNNSELEKIRGNINSADGKMAELFVQRMKAVKEVAMYKNKNNLQISDKEREAFVIANNSRYVKDEDEFVKESYVKFLDFCMELSKDYQKYLIENGFEQPKKSDDANKTCEAKK